MTRRSERPREPGPLAKFIVDVATGQTEALNNLGTLSPFLPQPSSREEAA